ncbi:hypothetical protein fugu_018543 [Takifugu bimaculatus]|uniref:Calmodulin-binding domain-containing protein n=1 Tax=Takifugu bimaculatus TaxID=433685 RepID=A0A4Z2BLD4_9TELE|nr:hypothetical protein fugu_018543 [Takifugu bimaculatus]
MEPSPSMSVSVADGDGLEDQQPLLPARTAPPTQSCAPHCGIHQNLPAPADQTLWLDRTQAMASTPLYNGHLYVSAVASGKAGDKDETYWRSHSIGWRLLHRRALFLRRQRLNDCALAVAIFGVVMMVLETELSWSVYSKLYVHDIGAEDWRIAMTTDRVALVALELAAVAIHPYPVGLVSYFEQSLLRAPPRLSLSETELEIVLALPMFLRFYLLGRAMMLHSRLFTDTASRSIGALNKIHFNTRFVGKTLMTTYPGTVLMIFSVSLWVVAAWGLHVCERHHNYRDLSSNYMEALWMVSVTFLSIGYGDVVPHTYCGRSICLLTGIMIQILTPPISLRDPHREPAAPFWWWRSVARKLELTRAEKHVHNFMMDSHISKRLKIAAANVLRETWLIYKHTKLSRDSTRVRTHQRKLLLAIHQLRRMKMEKRTFADQSNSLVDFCKMHNLVYDVLSEVQSCRADLDTHIYALEKNVEELREGFRSLMPLLSSTLSTQNSSIRHLLREREVKTGHPVGHSEGGSIEGPQSRASNIETGWRVELQRPPVNTTVEIHLKSVSGSHLISPLVPPADINRSIPSSRPQLRGGPLMLLPPE